MTSAKRTEEGKERKGKGEVAETSTYHATATQDGAHWVVTVNDLPKGLVGVTQGRTWSEARKMAVDVVAMLLEVPDDSFKVVMRPADPDMANAIITAEEARKEAELASKAAAEALAAAARILTAKATVRDAGSMLGVSHQYIAKLAPKKG
ncbi:type II toxin-antitoxin system HicB family antitoxin [Streptomyces sp. TRM 70361]|uniref:type II toxin-antitoxin system HicB family antitoxin n=1 Tax=Streptomyces sp. TRM 70361 TaxID=3116553 RepID=UPI002E7B14B2|nr:type II toxin-antitoxin system HicB family antitoxin [Streptomyces sp. TRM 70361]MEE1941685.1 type II toxin-antitoxin system HicB family antitoxin [Streptomyces sp. TRM 70361]